MGGGGGGGISTGGGEGPEAGGGGSTPELSAIEKLFAEDTNPAPDVQLAPRGRAASAGCETDFQPDDEGAGGEFSASADPDGPAEDVEDTVAQPDFLDSPAGATSAIAGVAG